MEDSPLTKRGTTITPIPNTPVINRELVKIQLEHDMKVADDELKFSHDTYWESCCLRVDKRAITYFGQMGVSVGIMTFCVAMLVMNQDCNTFARYSPLLTFLLGIALPQPQLHRNSD